jgi:hypothetical protein
MYQENMPYQIVLFIQLLEQAFQTPMLKATGLADAAHSVSPDSSPCTTILIQVE